MRDRMQQPESPGHSSGQPSEMRAHAARTQLTVIGAYAQLMRRRLRRGSLETAELDRALERIDLAVARLTRIVREWEEQGQDSPES